MQHSRFAPRRWATGDGAERGATGERRRVRAGRAVAVAVVALTMVAAPSASSISFASLISDQSSPATPRVVTAEWTYDLVACAPNTVSGNNSVSGCGNA
jgi:hypothetical protein